MKHADTRPAGSQQPLVDRKLRTAIRTRLLRWYDRHQRDLPWRRRAGDPYPQWVAEIMLQQTRVETVLAYYERFLWRFPTMASLAEADDEQVLKCWEGLGYYRRVFHLRDAARLLYREGRGIPSTAQELRRLSGIGIYTAAAVASIAFGEPVAAVDGNVARVLARLFDVTDDVLSSAGKKRIQRLASELISPKRPGDFNQAWMDLGSSICTPARPDCAKCPLRRHCLAAATDRTEALPIRGNGNRKVPQVSIVVGVFRNKRRFFVRRRPPGGCWSGLWEFPNEEQSMPVTKCEHGRNYRTESAFADARSTGRILQRLAEEVGFKLESPHRYVGTIHHRLTHRALEFRVFVTEVLPTDGEAVSRSTRWVTDRGFRALSVSTAHRRIHAAALRVSTATVGGRTANVALGGSWAQGH